MNIRRAPILTLAGVGLLGLLSLARCSEAADAKPDTKAAVKAAEAWLALVDAGKYAECWDQAATLLKSAVTKEEWLVKVKAVRPALGALGKRTLKSTTPLTELPGAPDGEYVVIQYATSFAKKKSAVETITPMKDPDGVWRVSGYYIK